jgi:hypothetical protein
MEVREKFYTISGSHLEALCRHYAFNNFKYNPHEPDFIVDFCSQLDKLVSKKIMSELIFTVSVEDSTITKLH